MSIREKIISAMHEAAETRELTLDKNLTDETKLLENGLDSLGYAIVVIALEEELGLILSLKWKILYINHIWRIFENLQNHQKKENSILYSLLEDKDKQDLVWITDKEVFNANKVKSIVSNLRKYLHKEKESRIAICINNPLNLATMLIYGESFWMLPFYLNLS